MKFKKLLGTTAKAVAIASDDESNKTLGSAFFKPYKSPANVFFRTTSIFTDPVLFAVGSAFFVISAAVELISTKANIIKHSNKIKFLVCQLTNSLIL